MTSSSTNSSSNPGSNPYGPVPDGLPAEPARTYNWAELARKHKNPLFQPGPDRRPKLGYQFDRGLDPDLAREVVRPFKERADIGHAVDFVTRHADQICFIPETKSFHVWNGHLWERDVSGRAYHLYKVWAAQTKEQNELLPSTQKLALTGMNRLLATAGMNSVMTFVQTDPRISAPLSYFDAEVEEVNTPAGVIDLRTGTLSEPDPRKLVRRSLTVAPDATVKMPLFKKFLAQTFNGDDDLTEYVRRMLGLSLIAAQDTQTFMYLYGKTGANGKGTLMTLMQNIFGTNETGYSITVNPSLIEVTRNEAHPTEIAQLAGVRMAVTSEVGSAGQFDVHKVKRLVSGETMSGRFMGKDYFSFAPTHTLWAMTNTHIKADATDAAFWRRLREVGFHHSTPAHERIEGLGEKMYAQEGPAIAAWILEGARKYLNEGITTPAVVNEAGKVYVRENDTVQGWLEEGINVDDPDGKMTYKGAYESYVAWCKLHRFRALSAAEQRSELFKLGYRKGRSNGMNHLKGLSFDIAGAN